jgi:hypothetical protein
MELPVMTSLTTRLAAKTFFGGDGTVYSDLKPGDLFRFPSTGAGTVCRKLFRGRYVMVTPSGWSAAYRTGKNTAVVKL